mgnify:CR=1 FL=1
MAKEVVEMEIKSNVGAVTKDVTKLDKATDKASGGFKGMGTAIKGMGTALKAAGIGLVIAAFVALQEALGRNQKVMNAVNTVMTTVSTTFNQVADVLVDVYNWVTKSSDRFDGLTKVIKGLMKIALTPLKLSFYAIKLGVEGAMLAWEDSFLGGGDEAKIAALRVSMQETAGDIKQIGLEAIEAGKQVVTNFGDAVGEITAIGTMAVEGITKISVKANFEQAKATTAAQNSSKLAEAQIQGLIEKYDRQAELQRQIRDDETKTFEERVAANKKLGEILNEQESEMLTLAKTRENAAALELSANKDNIDLQVAYQQTLNDTAGVEAQVAGFRSEQLTNQVSLEKELLETQRELSAESLEGTARELEELKTAYDQKVEMARKAGADITDITKIYEKQQTEIKNREAKKQEGFEKAKKDMQVEMAQQGLQLIGDAAGEGTGIAKAAAIAQATISGVQGVQNAFTAANANIGATAGSFGAYPVTMATLAGGFAAMNIAKIAAGSPPGGGGGAGGGGEAASQIPAPQMMSGAFELGGGLAPEPMKAFVVTDEMTNSQDQLANIRRQATI